MNWVVLPLRGLAAFNTDATASDTQHCTCTWGLISCGPTPRSLVVNTGVAS